ncbi:LytR family transcriptional regulator [Streptomyces fagopyri]|uniref:LytR family transcriptional regulator n=1 Tax=Streptomyces fagopyri TaxID=2662397 RepID=A0A5Q0LH97_9ACTN|nr:LytR C-terminal domain-containing protein [Streptomyces fagopyri]QFZ76410.1 LytR family transcriptional regulator [Streptomyces fagopyri]
MNDRYDGYTGGDQYELVGYDEFGQPVYRQVPPQPSGQTYDPYAQPQQPQQAQGYGYDPYANGGTAYDTGQQPTSSYDTGRQPTSSYDTGRQPASSYDTGQQTSVPAYDPYDPYGAGASAPDGAGTAYDSYGQQAPTSQTPRTAHSAPTTRTERGGQTGRTGPTGQTPQPGRPGQTGRAVRDGHAGYDGQTPGAAGATSTGQQPRVAEQTAYIPQQAGSTEDGGPRADRDHGTEQFAFVEEQEAESEDVIDWLKFTENRTERREEARRRARGRIVALVVVFALVVVGGVGYLWYAGKLPGTTAHDKPAVTAASSAQNRDVLVVHLHDTKGGGTSTALLVDNTTTKQGTTVLLPNSLALTGDDGSTTTLAKSVDDDGSSGTQEAIDTVLGTDIQGTWRLDTPYLSNLVELVGNIDITTNTAVPDPEAKKKGEPPLVKKGEDQTLSGKTAVAYATYRAPGEAQNAQLERFGQVMQGVLRKLSSDKQAATTTVQTLAQILDPPLTDQDLGVFLAKLADLAKGGDYKTALLPVQQDGTLSESATDSVVKDVLGGTAKSPEAGAAVRVGIKNATGVKSATDNARVVLVNGGYTFLDSGTAAAAESVSRITYADDAKKNDAVEVAKTLGLPTSSVKKGGATSNADVSVVLGQDYKVSAPTG